MKVTVNERGLVDATAIRRGESKCCSILVSLLSAFHHLHASPSCSAHTSALPNTLQSTTIIMASIDVTLLASHALLTPPTKRLVQPRTSPPSIIDLPQHTQRTESTSQTRRTPESWTTKTWTPRTPHRPSMPSIPCAPRKRPFREDALTATTKPQKRTRTESTGPDSPLCRRHRSRRTKLIPLDRAVCVPMQVLKAQREDASALLRPCPQLSDHLRKLVDLSVGVTLQKLRTPGGAGVIEAALRIPRKENGLKTPAATGSKVRGGARRA